MINKLSGGLLHPLIFRTTDLENMLLINIHLRWDPCHTCFHVKILRSTHSHWRLEYCLLRGLSLCPHNAGSLVNPIENTGQSLASWTGQKLIDDPRVSWRRRPSERQGQRGERYATGLLHCIGKYLYPKITKINDLWLWHRTKNFSVTESTMEKTQPVQ